MHETLIDPPSNPPSSTSPTPTKPTRRLLVPLLILLILTLSLSIATLVGATRTHNLLNLALTTNPWLLPLWLKYLPFLSLRVVEWTSICFTVIDILFVMGVASKTVVPSKETGKSLRTAANLVFLSALCALPATIMTSKKVSLATSGRNTAESWRCGWISLERSGVGIVEGMVVESRVPEDLGRVCRESRLATYGPLAILLAHLALFIAMTVTAGRFPKTPTPAAGVGGGDSDAHAHEDAEGNKMVELQVRGESSCSSSSSTSPPLEGKVGNRHC